MPGYRALSASVTGEAADHAREAERLRRDGDLRSAALLVALVESVSPDQDERFGAVLVEITSSARITGVPVERLVEALKTASARDTTPGLTDSRRAERYSAALLRLLAVYFDEVDR